MKGMTSIHIGNLCDDTRRLAEIIHAKCERARHKHEAIAVLVDDCGFVYAGQCNSGMTFLAMNKHPDWIVAVYSQAYPRHRETEKRTVKEVDAHGNEYERIQYPNPLPSVARIEGDLRARWSEIRKEAA